MECSHRYLLPPLRLPTTAAGLMRVGKCGSGGGARHHISTSFSATMHSTMAPISTSLALAPRVFLSPTPMQRVRLQHPWEPELELIRLNIAQKPLLWVEVGAHAVCKRPGCDGVVMSSSRAQRSSCVGLHGGMNDYE